MIRQMIHPRKPAGGSGVDPIDPLVLEAFQPIETAINLSAGSRLSLGPDPTLVVGPNVVDRWRGPDGVWQVSSVKGNENLCASDMLDATWTKIQDGNTIPMTIVDNLDGSHRLTFVTNALSTTGSTIQTSITSITGNKGFNGFDYKVISGDPTDLVMKYASGTPTAEALTVFNDDGEWNTAEGFPDTGHATMQLQLRGSGDGGSGTVTTLVIDIRFMRAADSLINVAPFLPYTQKLETYATDRVSYADYPWQSTGTIAAGNKPYGWGAGALSGATRPNSGSRLWLTTTFELRLSGSSQNTWFLDTSSNTSFTGTQTNGAVASLICNWDGVNKTGTGIPGTTASDPDTAQPSGSEYHIGNNAGGTRESGSCTSNLVYDRVLSSGEETTLANILNA